ncbi:hypothetical protein Caci_5055 [Catenulispora acidiphila DSM 44928]|uniref:Uncharacterized protein n=1 Tax=Catenulispora acidiphila (strain DSM 44928 / JCM 14897 / NBRC 102108 / NRRL B-24433 / ID139908) TaxID=479433 RepID=C7Q4W7_CATAD|nr:hypothetical protein [Catenulispora acidiphila]ACU73915.1 hypothetical protein Caci_5055 [Catenulispora acidiphila DSM 44928]
MPSTTVQDLWRSQSDALHDLSAFIDQHAPGTDLPLPLLHWSIGSSHTVRAEIHPLNRENGGGHRDPRAVITAYSEALGTVVTEHRDARRILLVARSRIGPLDERDGAGRTHVIITARIPTDGRHKLGGRAFLR